nr:site-specific integrase [Micromonospora sp. Llam0]
MLAGAASAGCALVDEYLAYLSDRNYSPRTVRAYGFDLLAFCRWLVSENVALDAVTTDVLLGFLRACREAGIPGRPGPNVIRLRAGRADRYAATTINGRLAAISGLFPNVIRLRAGRADRYAATTINGRLAAISGLFTMRSMRDPTAVSPVPKGREARRLATGGCPMGCVKQRGGVRPPVWAGMAVGCGAWRGGRRRGGGRGR